MGKKAEVPPAIPGDVLAQTTVVTFLAQKCQFSMYYRFGNTAPTRPDAYLNSAACAKAFRTTIVPTLAGLLSQGTNLLEVRVWSMKWPDVATTIDPYQNTPGTRIGDPLPPQIALVLSKRTTVRGKSGRGRMYICGMSESDSTNGEPTPAYLGIAAAFCNTLNQPITDAVSGKTFFPVVVSLINYKPFAPVPVAGPFWDVRGDDTKEIVPDDIWYTQRRRTFGKGQ